MEKEGEKEQYQKVRREVKVERRGTKDQNCGIQNSKTSINQDIAQEKYRVSQLSSLKLRKKPSIEILQ